MDKVAVLDFGGQYAHLIANRIRRLKVYSEILEGDTSAEKLKGYKGIILSGGPQSVYDQDSIKCDPEILNLSIPLLGVCYGHQLLAYMQGANVEPGGSTREFGLADMEIKKAEGIFKGLDSMEIVWMSHGDTVMNLPAGYEVIGSSHNGENAAIANFQKNFYGIQFHAEVIHTRAGQKIYSNFLDLCGVKREWEMENFLDDELEALRKKIGSHKVFMLVSGGVDSTVAFLLLAKAIGSENVYGLFIDTGFLRLHEAEEVMTSLQKLGFNNLHCKNAGAQYFRALEYVYDPEKKRKIIGDLFLQVQADVAKELGLNPEEWLLGQGTIYPDTIESGGSKHAAKIKTHHNRVPQIEALIKAGKVVEPLMQLYKDEVRELGEKLGLPKQLVWRHPFPGPGLAVRCLCAAKESYPDGYLEIEEKINFSLASYNLKAKILPIQSVGVQGDFRTYRHPVVLNGVADFQLLQKLATQLINFYPEINRVIWQLSPDRISSLKIQPAYLTPDRIQLLQKADHVVKNFIDTYGLDRYIWQFPTVLLPLQLNNQKGESIVLRPVESEEAMTANFYAMDEILLHELTKNLQALPGITGIFYDVTNKPPGTIEWE